MIKTKERFIINRNGEKEAVVLSITEYLKLLELIEDLEDAVELEHAVKTTQSFRPYEEIRKELIHKKKLNV